MDLGTLNSLVNEVRQAVPEPRILLFGSSSLLASFPEESPAAIGVELTLDADFFLDPDDDSSRSLLTDRLGKNREYHQATGHYGDFVDLRLSDSFPEGWRHRLVPMTGFDNVFALHPVDMAVTKVAATARSRLWQRRRRPRHERHQHHRRAFEGGPAIAMPSPHGCEPWTMSQLSSLNARA